MGCFFVFLKIVGAVFVNLFLGVFPVSVLFLWSAEFLFWAVHTVWVSLTKCETVRQAQTQRTVKENSSTPQETGNNKSSCRLFSSWPAQGLQGLLFLFFAGGRSFFLGLGCAANFGWHSPTLVWGQHHKMRGRPEK